MKSRFNRYISIVIILLAASCTTPKKLTIEILKPSEFQIDPFIRRAIVVDNILRERFEYTIHKGNKAVAKRVINSEDLAENGIAGLMNKLNESARFDSVGYMNYEKEVSGYHADLIARETKANLLIILSGLNIDIDAAISEETNSLSYLTFKIYEDWRVYDARNRKFLESIPLEYHESFGKYSRFDRSPEILNRLIKEHTDSIAYDMAYYAGEKFIPVWTEAKRIYFSSNNQSIKQAEEAILNNDWDTAAAILEKCLSSSNRSLLKQSGYNLAFVYEMQGELEKAHQTAQKSFRLYGHKETGEYANLLHKRVMEQYKINRELQGY